MYTCTDLAAQGLNSRLMTIVTEGYGIVAYCETCLSGIKPHSNLYKVYLCAVDHYRYAL